MLYKNNSSLVVEQNHYKCLHNVFGSDHRPVQLSLTIKDFKQPDFANLQKLLNREQPDQGYGQLDIEMVDIKSLNLAKIGKLTKFDFSQMIKPIQII